MVLKKSMAHWNVQQITHTKKIEVKKKTISLWKLHASESNCGNVAEGTKENFITLAHRAYRIQLWALYE